jgi:hypothetical protein
MRSLALISSIALIAAAVAPASAQTASGMAAMQYYAGTWNCAAVDEPNSNATETFTMENGTIRESVVLLPQGKMTTPYQLTIVMAFDVKNNRYVKTLLDNEATWSVSFAKPFTGNTEEWVDAANNTGKLGRSEIVRTDHKTFSIAGYSTVSQAKPDYTVICHRS